MKILYFCSIVSLLYTCVTADADFESVRIRHDYKDMSGRKGDPKGKYWHESTFHPHYDGRFTNHTLAQTDQQTNLSLLVRAYLSIMDSLSAETWLSHGTLLGWWWNGKIMPWDSDIDVQMSLPTVDFLASYYNLSMHQYERRSFMLEINPNYRNPSFSDRLNVIDARWIDVNTGLFIDITALRPVKGRKGLVASKDRHWAKIRDLFPLRESLFEGLPVRVPYDYSELLAVEYGPEALVRPSFNGHVFDSKRGVWEQRG